MTRLLSGLAVFLVCVAGCDAAVAPREHHAPVPTVQPTPPPVSEEVVSDDAPLGEGGTEDAGPGDAHVTESGLGIEDLRVGTGEEATAEKEVTVHYVGRLASGKVFDSSRTRNQPFGFILGGGAVIAGWDEGVVGMRVGGLRRLTIPPTLAYGERGHMPDIPPNAILVFDIELLKVE